MLRDIAIIRLYNKKGQQAYVLQYVGRMVKGEEGG